MTASTTHVVEPARALRVLTPVLPYCGVGPLDGVLLSWDGQRLNAVAANTSHLAWSHTRLFNGPEPWEIFLSRAAAGALIAAIRAALDRSGEATVTITTTRVTVAGRGLTTIVNTTPDTGFPDWRALVDVEPDTCHSIGMPATCLLAIAETLATNHRIHTVTWHRGMKNVVRVDVGDSVTLLFTAHESDPADPCDCGTTAGAW